MLTDVIRTAAEFARDLKTGWVRHNGGEPGESDLRPFVQAYRGNELVAWMCVNGDEEALTAARGAAGGFDADIIVIIADAWHTHFAADLPDDSTAEAEEAFRAAVLAGDATKGEGLFITALNRAGDLAALGMPYRVNGGETEWLGDQLYDATEAGEITGQLADALRRIMNETTVGQKMNGMGLTYADFGLDAEEMRAIQDAVTCTQLTTLLPEAMLWLNWQKGTKRAETLARHMPRGAFPR